MQDSIPVFFSSPFPFLIFLLLSLSSASLHSIFHITHSPQVLLDAKSNKEHGVCFFFFRSLKPVLQKQLQQRVSSIHNNGILCAVKLEEAKMVSPWSPVDGSLKSGSTICLSFNLIPDFNSGCLKIVHLGGSRHVLAFEYFYI